MSAVRICQPLHLQFLLPTLSFNWQNPRLIPVHSLTVISMIGQERASVPGAAQTAVWLFSPTLLIQAGRSAVRLHSLIASWYQANEQMTTDLKSPSLQ